MPIYVFIEATPIIMRTVSAAAEAIAIAKEQAILGVRTSFADATGPITFFELQARSVAPKRSKNTPTVSVVGLSRTTTSVS